MRYVVIGCGAIGGTVAAGLARDGHDVLVCDADPAVVAAINDRGLRIEGPVENFTARVPAVLPGRPARPDRRAGAGRGQGPAHRGRRGPAGRAADPDGFVVSLQNGLNAAGSPMPSARTRWSRRCVNFGADVTEPGVVLRGNRATFLIGEPDGRLSERVARPGRRHRRRRGDREVLGYLWAKEAYGAMLFATAVSDLPIDAVFEDPAYRACCWGWPARSWPRPRSRPMPFDGFDPADLDGSLGRLVDFNRGSAKTHSGIYRDLAVRHRPTEVPAILGPLTGPADPPDQRADRRDRAGQTRAARGPTWTCSPPTSGWSVSGGR